MELSNRSKWLLGLFVAIGLFIVSIIPASAQTIAYHPLRYGTNQTSMADGYFVKPANVVVKNHLYYVTMEIKTAKSLSSFPVKVNWVNGKAPLNVRRVKDRAGDSLLYYSFYANNLKKRINAKLAIDVPKVYKAHHLISFKFSTAGLPSLGRTHAAAATPKTATSTTRPKAATSSSTKAKQTNSQPKAKKAAKTASSAKKKQPKANAPKKTKKAAKTASSAKKKQSKAKQSSAKKASSQPSKASSNLTKPAKNTSDKPQAKKSGVPWIVGGVTVIAGLSAGLWIYFKH
ncbi:NEAT domain-containing protein [Lentilactobacillus parabuchneri]